MTSFTKIIVPVDGSESSKKAADKAYNLGKKLNLPIHLLYVVDTSIYSNTITNNQLSLQWESILKKEGESILKEIEQMNNNNDIRINKEILKGKPSEEILNKSSETDLIIMGGKGKSMIDRIFIGSVTENVVHHSDASVIIVK